MKKKKGDGILSFFHYKPAEAQGVEVWEGRRGNQLEKNVMSGHHMVNKWI